MNEEELKALLAKDDKLALAKSLKGLNEKQRHELANVVAPLVGKKYDNFDEAVSKHHPRHAVCYDTVQIAALGLCSLTKAKRADIRYMGVHNYTEECPVVEVLSDRRPDWIDEWVEKSIRIFDGTLVTGIGWVCLHRLILCGACSRPTTDRYMELFAMDGNARSVRRDPLLLQNEVPRLFQFEPPKSSSYTTTAVSASDYSWGKSLVDLIEEGLLNRTEVLSWAVRGLVNPFRPAILRGFRAFIEKLAPTDAEWAGLQPDLRVVLGASSSEMVAFAVKRFELLQKQGPLDMVGFATGVTPAFDSPKKGAAVKSLKLLQKVMKKEPELAPAVCDAAIYALDHPDASVQEAACKVLAKHGEALADGQRDRIADALELVSATVRPKLAELCGVVSTEEDGESDVDLEGSLANAAKLPAGLAQLMAVDKACTAVQEGKLPPAVSFTFRQVPWLDVSEPFKTIEDFDALLTFAAQAVEGSDDIGAFDRVLDAISRIPKPEDFDKRIAPLVKQCKKLDEGYSRVIHRGIIYLILIWSEQVKWEDDEKEPWFELGGGIGGKRRAEMFLRLAAGDYRTPLATPTHEGNWIHPKVLVERVRCWLQDGAEISRGELTQALLRLAPDGRGPALADAQDIDGTVGACLRYALGDGELPASPDSPDIWLAAYRSREPLGSAPPPFDNLGEDPFAAGEDTDIDAFLDSYINKDSYKPMPPVLACEPDRWNWNSLKAVRRSYPGGIIPYLYQIEEWNESGKSFDAYVTTRYEPKQCLATILPENMPWTEQTPALLLDLLGSSPQEAVGITDVLLAAIDDGRWNAAWLSRGIVEMRGNTKNLAQVCKDIASVGLLQSYYVLDLIHRTVVLAEEDLPGGYSYLFEVYHELLCQEGTGVPENTRSILSDIKGTSKTAKLAKRIAKIQEGFEIPKAVLTEALANRVKRANRWLR